MHVVKSKRLSALVPSLSFCWLACAQISCLQSVSPGMVTCHQGVFYQGEKYPLVPLSHCPWLRATL